MAIHPTAIVDKKAEIADSAEIGPFVVIEGPVKIGTGVKIYPNAYISGWTEIGDRCEIHPGAVVGHLPQDFHFTGERSYCKLGAGTIIREFASVHRGTQPESCTSVGENCFLLGYAHVGHNCELGTGVKVYNGTTLAGHVTVGDNAIISANVGIHQFARIGAYAMIGGVSRIAKDVPPYMKVIRESECVGYNAIGLRRAGVFTAEEIAEVREAYRILFRSGLPMGKALSQFAEQVKTRTGRNILEFTQSESKLGLVGRRGHKSSGNDGNCDPSPKCKRRALRSEPGA